MYRREKKLSSMSQHLLLYSLPPGGEKERSRGCRALREGMERNKLRARVENEGKIQAVIGVEVLWCQPKKLVNVPSDFRILTLELYLYMYVPFLFCLYKCH